MTHFFEQASVLQACTIPLMANFFQLVLSMIWSESPSPPRFANFKSFFPLKGWWMLTTIAIAKMTRKLFSLDIHISTWGWWMLAHEHYWGSIEENFSSSFRSFSWSGECLLTRITQAGLKKASAQSSDHFPEVVVNSCSQELLWTDWRKL